MAGFSREEAICFKCNGIDCPLEANPEAICPNWLEDQASAEGEDLPFTDLDDVELCRHGNPVDGDCPECQYELHMYPDEDDCPRGYRPRWLGVDYWDPQEEMVMI